jgi:hypothetical protein
MEVACGGWVDFRLRLGRVASPSNRVEVAAQRQAVVRSMVSSVQHGESRQYHIGVVGYYIEGVPHSATGLTVNQHTPPDIVLTDESFTCTAFFPPHTLDVNIVLANGIIPKYYGDQVLDLVPVRLEVKLIDIWAVSESIKGQQHDLFF